MTGAVRMQEPQTLAQRLAVGEEGLVPLGLVLLQGFESDPHPRDVRLPHAIVLGPVRYGGRGR